MDDSKKKKLDDAIKGQLDRGVAVGIAARIIKDGQTIYESYQGYADRENEIPIKSDTIYRMYSTTKPITAVALMILVERGIVSLDDKVNKYLWGFNNQVVEDENGIRPVEKDVTIYNLLTMTSGLIYPDPGSVSGRRMQELFDEFYRKAEEGKAYNTVEMCNRIGRVPLCVEPGTLWIYGTGADVIGAVIEIATGMRFSDYLKKEIFEPLGMKDTDFYVPEEKRPRFSKMYDRNEKGELIPCNWQHLGLAYDYAKNPEFEIGGAGLVSTLDDYQKFATMLMNKGSYNGVRIISEKSVDYLTTNHLRDDQRSTLEWDSNRGYTYGGLMRVLDNEEKAPVGTMGEYGWDGWSGVYFNNDPVNRITFLYMIQVCAGGVDAEPVRELRKILYE